jgi:hypothetical protein
MRQRSHPAVPDDAAVIENLVKLGGSSTALSGCQVFLSAYTGQLNERVVADLRGQMAALFFRANVAPEQRRMWSLLLR